MHLIPALQTTSDLTTIAPIIEHLTVVTLLGWAVWAFMTEHLVSGRQHRRLQKQNDRLLNLAFKLQGLAKSATDILISPAEESEP